jgi:plastocyanin
MAVRRAAVVWAGALIVACGLLALPLVAFAATSAVNIQNSAFAPTSTPIKVGDTVTWTNRDAFSHTSTSDTGAWDTGVIVAGASGSFTFRSAGTFGYHCSIHSFMKGTVTVQAVSTPQPTPPPTAPPTVPPTAPPTSVRTAPPTIAPTAPPTAAPTDAPTVAPTAAAPSATASPTLAAAETPTASPSPSAVAVQLTPAPVPGPGPGPIVFGVAALAVVALGAIAFYLVRRS